MSLYKYWNNGGAARIHINKISKSWTEANATSAYLYGARSTDLGIFTSPDALNVWESYNVTSAIADFIKSPSTNYGLMLSNDQGTDGGAAWRSANYQDSTYRPKLIVTYQTGLPISASPEFTPAQGNFDDSVIVTINTKESGAVTRYTVDGSDPMITSPVFTSPIVVKSSTGITFKAKSFKDGMDESAIVTSTYRANSKAQNTGTTLAGLKYYYYKAASMSFPLSKRTINDSGVVSNFDISKWNGTQNFGVLFLGYINVPTDGTYSFFTDSDDGSILYIDGVKVVDNYNARTTSTEASGFVALKAGKHVIQVDYMQGLYGMKLSVSYTPPSGTKTAVSPSLLSYSAAQGPTATLAPVHKSTFSGMQLVGGDITLSSNSKEHYELAVISSNGKQIFCKTVNGHSTLSTKKWAPGYYVAVLRQNARVISKLTITVSK